MIKTALCACLVFLSLVAIPAVHGADKSLQLTIALEKVGSTVFDGKQFHTAKIKATFTNKSGKDRTFYLEDCGICFWRASINGGSYGSIMNAVHSKPCSFKNSVTLKPGKSISKTIEVELSGFSRPGDLKTIKILYLPSMDAKDNLESNMLKI